MAKRRRKPPQPQARPARPTEREWGEQQQASAKRLAESPFFRSLQEHHRRLRDSPFDRSLLEDPRRLREWQERNLRAPDTSPEATAPSAKQRRKGGGRKLSLTDAEIARLQAAYNAAYRAEPKRKQADVFDELCRLLGRDVGDTTLRYYVVRPLRGNRPSVISARRNKPTR
jgi:hypothetical protein